ncbi:hypothetical protein B0H11DRAFT_2108307 [Mycena galericulata]|nr:hypothetical protein B0H11DRAFT_2108307 [Mycena galericulata]
MLYLKNAWKNVVKRKLPELPSSEEFTGPLIKSDFSKYLSPLYARGWYFAIQRHSPVVQAHCSLWRTLRFPTLEAVAQFSQYTFNVLGTNIDVFRNLDIDVRHPASKSLTRDQVRLAYETESEYAKIVRVDLPLPPVSKSHRVPSLEKMRSIEKNIKPQGGTDPLNFPFAVATLPPAPPQPGIPPPPLTNEDLEIYIKPLALAGWSIVAPRVFRRYPQMQEAFKGCPSLHRRYHFTDYTAARSFLHRVITVIPAYRPDSFAGVDVRLHSESTPGWYTVFLWSGSELAADAPKRYGISLADVRFAIEIENEIRKNWAGRAETSAFQDKVSWVPNTVEELLMYRKFKGLHRSSSSSMSIS